jgi:hypothetical protein
LFNFKSLRFMSQLHALNGMIGGRERGGEAPPTQVADRAHGSASSVDLKEMLNLQS